MGDGTEGPEPAAADADVAAAGGGDADVAAADEDPGFPPSAYRPTVSAEEERAIRAWHERAYTDLRAGPPGRHVTHLGRAFLVPEHVFPPAPMSALLGAAVLAETRPTDRVLDMGTGSGVNAVLAASVSRDVLGVDINPHAVAAAEVNAAAHGVADRTRFLRSDVFDAVEGRFDLVVFDPPFRWFAPRDLLETSMTDEGYGALTRFVSGVRGHLAPGGRVLLFFGSSGDLAYLEALVDRSGLDREVAAEELLTREGETVVYRTYRLTVTADADRPPSAR